MIIFLFISFSALWGVVDTEGEKYKYDKIPVDKTGFIHAHRNINPIKRGGIN